jgi:osmoprotectant transport system permease protein
MNVIELVNAWFAEPTTWSGTESIPVRVAEHLLYSMLAMLIAAAIALPLGSVLGHLHRGQTLVLTIANTIRALPTLGLLTLVVILSGIGFLPPLIALVVLAIPPMLVNAFEGVRSVDPTVVDAARGMGLRGRSTLLSVEVPVALPIILLGVRLAAIQVVSAATIAAYVGLGGLGRFIFDGLGRRDFGQVAGGSIVAAALAIATEVFFVLLAATVTSQGVSRRRRPGTPGALIRSVLQTRKKSAA